MDHEESQHKESEQQSKESVEINGFATELASSLVKESIEQSGQEEREWSIQCSQDCHSHRHEAGVSCGPGQLCWTPETTGSLDVMDTARDSRLCKAEAEESEDVRLKKGVSVPNVSREEEEDRLSSSSDNCKSHKKSFLRSLGLGGKAPGDAGAGRGPKVKSLRKTLSSLFKGGSEDSSESRSSFAFLRLPSRCKSTAAAAVPPCQRALPPVPARQDTHSANDEVEDEGEEESRSLELRDSPDTAGARDSGQGQQADNLMDFAASIERVKDRGWYWGPLSGEAAERILSGEPDGSFVVRDSSDQHYIFSLTFKLNGFVRHVRIEHDQGNFSFGSFTRFKSTTIVDFIENAVEHSRSGRYLFFLHRRPVLGPMRVQLLHPVSRFKRVQSLQHLCRYVIVKVVRKDHLDQLPVPSRIKSYLNTPFYYSEQVTGNEDSGEQSPPLESVEEAAED